MKEALILLLYSYYKKVSWLKTTRQRPDGEISSLLLLPMFYSSNKQWTDIASCCHCHSMVVIGLVAAAAVDGVDQRAVGLPKIESSQS